jgi:hypothetical protein
MLLIKYRSDLNRGKPNTLPQRQLKEWGIGKNARADALRRLEQAGLIEVAPEGVYAQGAAAPKETTMSTITSRRT